MLYIIIFLLSAVIVIEGYFVCVKIYKNKVDPEIPTEKTEFKGEPLEVGYLKAYIENTYIDNILILDEHHIQLGDIKTSANKIVKNYNVKLNDKSNLLTVEFNFLDQESYGVIYVNGKEIEKWESIACEITLDNFDQCLDNYFKPENLQVIIGEDNKEYLMWLLEGYNSSYYKIMNDSFQTLSVNIENNNIDIFRNNNWSRLINMEQYKKSIGYYSKNPREEGEWMYTAVIDGHVRYINLSNMINCQKNGIASEYELEISHNQISPRLIQKYEVFLNTAWTC